MAGAIGAVSTTFVLATLGSGIGELKQWNEMDAQMLHQLRAIGVVSNKLELDSIFGALQRTGLVNYFAGGFGGAWYQPTPRLAALLALIDTDAAMAEPSR